MSTADIIEAVTAVRSLVEQMETVHETATPVPNGSPVERNQAATNEVLRLGALVQAHATIATLDIAAQSVGIMEQAQAQMDQIDSELRS